jgi:hypothetical protein
MRTVRNIAIIALLALAVSVVPGGGNAAEAVLTALTLCFLAVLAVAGYQIYRQNKLSYFSLTDRQRAVLVGAVGAIVLMIAGTDELLDTGFGVLVWIAVLGLAAFSIFSVWAESQRY